MSEVGGALLDNLSRLAGTPIEFALTGGLSGETQDDWRNFSNALNSFYAAPISSSIEAANYALYGLNPLSSASAEERATATYDVLGSIFGVKLGGYTPKVSTQYALPSGTTSINAAKESTLPNIIHDGKQGKHVINHNNYIEGRSTLNSDINPQQLLNGVHSGQYEIIGTNARGEIIVNFGKPIGVDAKSGQVTNIGTIHSSKNGAHIVPIVRND